MSEAEDIAALYHKYGYALFRVCVRLAPSAEEAHTLLRATFRACADLRTDAPFERLREFATRLAGREVDDGEDVACALYLADALSGEDRRALEAQLIRSPGGQVRLAVQRSERASFYATTPPEVFALRTVDQHAPMTPSQRPPTPQTQPPRTLSPAMPTLLALGVVAIVGGVWALRPSPQASTHGAPGRPTPPIVMVAPASAPVAVVSVPVVPTAVVQTPVVPAPVAPAPAATVQPASAPAPAPSDERLMATFDFGETLGRVSLHEGRNRKKEVPQGTKLQVRANIPESGYVTVLAQDADAKSLRTITAALKVEPRWRALAQLTIDGPQTLFVIFSRDAPTAPPTLATLADTRNARLDITIEP